MTTVDINVDIGIDAARILTNLGPGQVRAVFPQALYLRVPGGLVVLGSTQLPRGPLHLRMTALPAVPPGTAVEVTTGSLRIGNDTCPVRAPTWSPRLPSQPALRSAQRQARDWLPSLGPVLDVGSEGRAGLPRNALIALRRGDVETFAGMVAGRGAGLTPAGDDVLAGVFLVASVFRGGSRTGCRRVAQCASQAPTNDIARAFLACAGRGRCIEPAHRLLDGLANHDRRTVRSAVTELNRFGSSSGAALTYGIRTALLELPAAASGHPDRPPPPHTETGV
jgi:hypothetical protein